MGSGPTTVTNQMAFVQVTCNLSSDCVGAILLCLPGNYLCTNTPGDGRIAGSDFRIRAGNTSDVPIGVTDFGEQVVTTNSTGVSAYPLVDMLDYGDIDGTDGVPTSLTLTTTDPPAYPPGATAGCGGVLFVGPDTSCPFAQNVEQAFLNEGSNYNNGGTTVTASSPVTGQSYEMQCAGGAPVVCRGGTNALVEFYD